jgi:ABC-2 type transport system permease protein
MRVIDLALKDLSQLVRDWKSAAFLVGMPIIFTIMFTFVFGGAGEQEDPRLPVGFLDQDGGSVLSGSLLDLLNTSDVIRPDVLGESHADDVEKMVQDGDLAAVVIVPPRYGEQLQASTTDARLTVLVDEASPAGMTVQNEVQAAAARVVGAVQMAHLSTEAFEGQAGFADNAARRLFFDEALDRAIAAWEDPPLTVAMTQSGAIAEEDGGSEYEAGSAAHSSAGIMVQFAIAGLIGAAEILVLERKSRTLQRLLTTAITRFEIILGHSLAMFVMILVQLVILVAFGQLALGVDYMREPLGILLVMVTLALWAASLGLLIGTFARTEEQVIIYSLIPMFVLSGLGGAWMPLEFTPEAFQTVGHLTPTAWAIDGFENVIVRGLGLDSVLLPAGILLAYAIVFFAIAVWRFKFE